MALSVPLAAALTELVLKPLIGLDSLGRPLPQRTRHHRGRLATALTVLLARTRQDAAPPASAVAFAAFLMTAAVAVGVIGANMHHFTDTAGGAAVGTGTVLVTALTASTGSAGRIPTPR